MPDVQTPVKMSLDPIGTPRRSGSITSSMNGSTGLGGLSVSGPYPSNGTTALNGHSSGSRFFSNGLPASNGANAASESSHITNYWSQHQQFKQLETVKNSFVEEVLTRYAYLHEKYNELLKTVEQNQVSSKPTEGAQVYYDLAVKLNGMLERDAFMLILIDGDGMIFQNQYLQKGEAGGRQAADLLKKSVNDWARANLQGCPGEFRISARVFANVKGLAETCRRAGIVSSAETVEDFVRGFTISNDLFNFIDVGPGKDRADVKMNAEFKSHIYNFQCRHILFGCSHDNGFARLLENYTTESDVTSRVTLMQGVPFEKELMALPYNRMKFPNIFRETKVNLTMPDLLTDNPRVRQDSRIAFNPASGVFTPSPRTPAPDTPIFSNRSIAAFPSPAQSLRGDLTRTNSIASSAAVSDIVAPASGAVAGGGWAGIARASAKLPFKDLSRPPAEPKVVAPAIRVNKDGQRIDPPMEYSHEKVYELKKMKYCNQHYIGKGCCHYDSGNSTCPHKHDTKLSNDEKKWLRVVARETVCKKGTGCMDMDCIYGHHCPYPLSTEGSMRGWGCVNGEGCRFAREMHSMDTTVFKTYRSEDLL